VFNSNSFTCDEMLKKPNLRRLHNRRLEDISITMFKYHIDLLPTYLSDIFVPQYNLRTENNISNFKLLDMVNIRSDILDHLPMV